MLNSSIAPPLVALPSDQRHRRAHEPHGARRCFCVNGRTNWYTSVDEIRAGLDSFLVFYNFYRTHQGYRVVGRTPTQALRDLIAAQRTLPSIPIPVPEVPHAA